MEIWKQNILFETITKYHGIRQENSTFSPVLNKLTDTNECPRKEEECSEQNDEPDDNHGI